MIDKIRTVLFTVIVTAVFALIVSGVNQALAGRIEMNKQVARQQVILDLFGLASDNLDSTKISELFKQKVTKDERFENSGLEAYRLTGSANGLLVCSFTGQGFWDRIHGFIALNTGELKIAGVEFTQHGETPGLGGRISEPEFKKRFEGIPVGELRSDGLRVKFVAEGTSQRSDEIDGITGASGTTAALERIINRSLENIINTLEGRAAK